jgi:hypothetical protein
MFNYLKRKWMAFGDKVVQMLQFNQHS